MQLTPEKIEFYRQNGFVQIENVFAPHELAELSQALGEVMQSKEGSSVQIRSRRWQLLQSAQPARQYVARPRHHGALRAPRAPR
jgi:hypothetical protein